MGVVTFAGQAATDPASLLATCRDQDLPVDQWLGKANAFTLPRGRESGTGRVLLSAAALGRIDTTLVHPLVFGTLTFKRIALTRATCVLPTARGAGGNVFLCDLADDRHFLRQRPIDRAYNVPSADGSGYLAATKDGGSAWTWATMAADLWDALGLAAVAPALPFVPDGTPEGFAFYGGSAWDALCDVLDRLACDPVFDPRDDSWAVVRRGSNEAAARAALEALDAERVWDGYPGETVPGWRPETVRTLFRRVPAPADGASPFYFVDTTLGVQPGVRAGTVVTLADDLAARGATGTPSNSAALDARAAERAADWERARSPAKARLGHVYRGTPGKAFDLLRSAATAVAVYDRGAGLMTEVFAGPGPAWGRAAPAPPGGGDGSIWIRITGFPDEPAEGEETGDGIADINEYQFEQIRRVFNEDDPPVKVWEAVPSGITDATRGPVRDANGNLYLKIGSVWRAWPDEDGEGWTIFGWGFALDITQCIDGSNVSVTKIVQAG